MKKSLIIVVTIILLIIIGFVFIGKDRDKMEIKSVFDEGEKVPAKYTCDGEDINPELEILDIPENTKSLVLIMDDPDSPTGTWDHWVVFNIEVSPTSLDVGTAKIGENSVPEESVQGLNSWDKNEYGGPCPGSGTHRYFFKIYALDVELELDSNARKDDVEKAMESHILGKAELLGVYSRE